MGDIHNQMEEIIKALNLRQSLVTSELTGIKDDLVGDREWVKEHQQVMEHQSEMMRQISLMQQDSKLIDVELGNIAGKSISSDDAAQQLSVLEPIKLIRMTIAEMKQDKEAQMFMTKLDFMGFCLDAVEAQFLKLKTTIANKLEQNH